MKHFDYTQDIKEQETYIQNLTEAQGFYESKGDYETASAIEQQLEQENYQLEQLKKWSKE